MSIAIGIISFFIHSMMISFMLGRLLRPRRGFLITSAVQAAGMSIIFPVLIVLTSMSAGLGTVLLKLLCIPASVWLLHIGSAAEKLRLCILGVLLCSASEAVAFAVSGILTGSPQALSEPAARVFSSGIMLVLVLGAVLVLDCDSIAKEKLGKLLFIILVSDLIHLLFVVFYYITQDKNAPELNGLIQAVFQAILISIFFTQYFTVLRMRRLSEKEKELESIQREIEFSRRYYSLADLQYKDISMLRHDIQNHFSAVRKLIGTQEDAESEARNIIESISNRLETFGTLRFCDRPGVNALLTVKLNDKSLNDVKITIRLKDTERCSLTDNDLCGVISELFDSAAEICRRQDKDSGAGLEIFSSFENGNFVLGMSCSFPDKEPVPSFEVSRLICQSSDGRFNVTTADDKLTVETVLP